jgi:hypothetical protein
MQELKQYILTGDWQAILEYGVALDDEERNIQMILLTCVDVDGDLLQPVKKEVQGAERILYHENRRQVTALLHYARIVCTRSYEDLACIVVGDDPFRQSALYHYLLHPAAGCEPLIAFFQRFRPDYLDKYLNQLVRDRFFNCDFKLLWMLYEQGWIAFEEAFFVRRLFTLYSLDNDHEADAAFLAEHPEALERVFLQFYRYEIPVLDRIKCNSLEYPNGLSIQAHVYWTEICRILLSRDLVQRSVLAQQLLGSLRNNWKKPHLDWHIRLLALVTPDNTQYLAQQRALIAAMDSAHNGVLTFVLRALKQICCMPGFDYEAFLNAAVRMLLRRQRALKITMLISRIMEHIATASPVLHGPLIRFITASLIPADLQEQGKLARLRVS